MFNSIDLTREGHGDCACAYCERYRTDRIFYAMSIQGFHEHGGVIQSCYRGGAYRLVDQVGFSLAPGQVVCCRPGHAMFLQISREPGGMACRGLLSCALDCSPCCGCPGSCSQHASCGQDFHGKLGCLRQQRYDILTSPLKKLSWRSDIFDALYVREVSALHTLFRSAVMLYAPLFQAFLVQGRPCPCSCAVNRLDHVLFNATAQSLGCPALWLTLMFAVFTLDLSQLLKLAALPGYRAVKLVSLDP